MGLNNIVKSRGFRNFMAKLYGWGASVVILGALFKINHYPGAEYMLIIGLGTESIIFFFSAFEPPHVEPDWSLVYPELAGMYHGITAETEIEEKLGKEGLTGDLDQMLAEAKIGPELIESLGQGLRNLSENTSRLRDVTEATLATSEFTENMRSASTSLGKLSEGYDKQSETLASDINASQTYVNSIRNAAGSASGLSEAYAQASQAIKKDLSATEAFAESIKTATQSANQLTDRYAKSSEILSKTAEALDFTKLKEHNYGEQLQKISQNLASLNTVYEMQLQQSRHQADASGKLQQTMETFLSTLNGSIENTSRYREALTALNTVFESQMKGSAEQVETTARLQKTLDAFLAKLNESADKTVQYNQGLEELSRKVTALNTVYGNMLSAMNVKV
ncbi:MAG: gliding motility protein GldL [Bacteroidales bacterium]|nr:gliding motility protein GldL [Bacteroidales bacterium]